MKSYSFMDNFDSYLLIIAFAFFILIVALILYLVPFCKDKVENKIK